jgi:integrase/recombinase XerD
MINQLFEHPYALNRYLTGLLLEERSAYLYHCAEQGFAKSSLKLIAHYQLVITDYLDLQNARAITPPEIEAAADRWAQRPFQPRNPNVTFSLCARERFIWNATDWLRFLGRLQEPPPLPRPFAQMMSEFTNFMRHERGLSETTIAFRCQRVEHFLSQVLDLNCALSQLTITQIDDAFLQRIDQGRYARCSIHTLASALRAFFRYAANRGWCRSDLAEAIKAPRVFRHESLPFSPTWEEVQRLIESAGGQRPVAVRDRAILLLLAHYGLRVGEVCALQLDDLDWEREIIRLRRNKDGRPQQLPLTQIVGEAILRYLKEVRPRISRRELFLSLRPPVRPLTRRSIYSLVRRRWNPLGVAIAHHGPHSLRHACATRLINHGVSLKEIGDQLGHRDLDTTRIYAKVDLTRLRVVADFDLGGVL